jgi:DNA-binding NarL/FixJ family response regulator
MARAARLKTLLLVDDHAIFRDGLRRLITRNLADVARVVGEAANGKQAVAVAKLLSPDIVLMDVRMPELNGIEATRALVSDLPGVAIIGLSAHHENDDVCDMLRAGARGYILKSVSAPVLRDAIQSVGAGNHFYTPEVRACLDEEAKRPGTTIDITALTEREIEVLRLICQGQTSKEIGEQLGISLRTVQGHRDHMLHKVKARHMVDLLLFAIRNKVHDAN